MFKFNPTIKYTISGLLINLFGYLLYAIFIRYFNFYAYISLIISYSVSIICYFFSQTFFVFNVKLEFKTFLKFLFNTLFIFLLNIILLFISIQLLRFDELFSQLYIMVFLVIINFINQKKLIFNNKK